MPDKLSRSLSSLPPERGGNSPSHFKTILTLVAIALALGAISIWVGHLSYSWLPPQASIESQLVDDLFSFLVTLVLSQ